MRKHLANAVCGVVDYVAYPLGMLLVAPLMITHLGAAQYGLWAIATGVVSMGAILASGFGDASLQLIAAARGEGDEARLCASVRASLAVQTALGAVCALACIAVAEAVARRLSAGDARFATQSVLALRFAGGLVLVRSIEAACIGTQRAFECYWRAIGVSLSARMLSLTAACVLTLWNYGVVWVLGCALGLASLGALLQVRALATRLAPSSLFGNVRWRDLAAVIEQGRYTWMVAASGVMFSYADRMVLGVARGAAAVAWYALCVQIAQPVYGFAANGLHFLFPHFARVRAAEGAAVLRGKVRKAQVANGVMVAGLAAGAVLAGKLLFHHIMGTFAEGAGAQLLVVVLSFALLGASVTATYALFALRRAQAVAWTMLLGAAAMLAGMPLMLSWWGPTGLAWSRVVFGAVCLSLYVPLWRVLYRTERTPDTAVGGWTADPSAGGAL